jgi:hypothetical protein
MNRIKRTEFRRLPDRGSHDWATINAILDVGFSDSMSATIA